MLLLFTYSGLHQTKFQKKLREYSGNKATKYFGPNLSNDSNYIVVSVPDYQSRVTEFKPTRFLQGLLGLSTFWSQFNEYQKLLATWRLNFLLVVALQHRGRWTLTLKDHIFLDGVKNDLLWSSKRLFKKSNSTTFFEI